VLAIVLNNLEHCLGVALKDAEKRGYDSQVLMHARLAPDMLALPRQVQIACDMAKFAVARLSGVTAPSFEDNEATLPELQTRIRATIEFIRSITPAQLDGTEDKEITFTVGRGDKAQTRTMLGEAYLKHWVIANVYFHVTTTYALLRHNGVPLGKADFLQGAAAS
jgi:hypothetical protein